MRTITNEDVPGKISYVVTEFLLFILTVQQEFYDHCFFSPSSPPPNFYIFTEEKNRSQTKFGVR